MMNPQEYAEHIRDVLNILAQSHARGDEIDVQLCTAGLEPGRPENKKVRDYCTKVLKISAKEFDGAMRSLQIKEELGTVPRTAAEFVLLMAEQKRVTATYNGLLRLNELPYVLSADGSKYHISPDLWHNDEFKILINSKFNRVIGFGELQQMMRAKAAELHLEFPSRVIDDASEIWYAEVCRDRLWRIEAEISFTDLIETRKLGQASLLRLAESCFVCPTTQDAHFVVAVFNKFMWQVKRKIADMPIFDHLMPVLLGRQGNGKSTLVRSFLEPVKEIKVDTDFNQVTDDRIITMWRSFIGFFDEMKGAKRSDMEAVKHAITAISMSRRAMRTNVVQEVAQNLTFIGCANPEDLSDLIRDTSGTRRFIGLKTKETMDWEVVNSIDWQAVWQSVDEKTDDPMKSFDAMLRASQAEDRTLTSFESWIDSLTKTPNGNSDDMSASYLFHCFSEYEEKYFPAIHKTAAMDINVFGKKLKTHCRSSNAKFSTKPERSGSSKSAYRWIG